MRRVEKEKEKKCVLCYCFVCIGERASI